MIDKQKMLKGKCSPLSDGVGVAACLHPERSDPATGYHVHEMCAILPRLCPVFWKWMLDDFDAVKLSKQQAAWPYANKLGAKSYTVLATLTAVPSLYPFSILDEHNFPSRTISLSSDTVLGKVPFERYHITPQITFICPVPGLGTRGNLG